MNGMKKILIAACCLLLLAAGWLAALFSKTDADRQAELLAAAQSYLDDGIYVKAAPLLEQAAGYSAKHTLEAEEKLKEAYAPLLEQSGYARKYTGLLDKQMAREDCAPDVYLEAARYYLEHSKESDAFAALRTGIEKTGSRELTDFYEANRYAYDAGYAAYQEVTDFLNGYIQVRQDGYWGLASASGSLALPCEYESLTTCWNGEAVIRRDGVVSGIDLDGNRVALYKGDPVRETTNFNENRLCLHLEDGWVLATGELTTGQDVFEALGAFSDGGAAAKQNGKWGVIGRNGVDWLVEPSYDGVACDGLGRCWYDGTAFVRDSDGFYLLADGQRIAGPYEDAQPFAGGWAAVKKDGKWGYIDREGAERIGFRFENARSFTMHLAAVETARGWGYVGLDGTLVIDPVFLDAKAFSDGTAPVKTADGWQFITLLEYKTGISGL